MSRRSHAMGWKSTNARLELIPSLPVSEHPWLQELLERYSKLRLAVEMANDKHEHTTYEQLAKRVMQQERRRAAAHLMIPGALSRPTGDGLPAGHNPGHELAAAREPTSAGLVPRPASIALAGHSFEDLIAATRQRDALHRALKQSRGV